MNKTLYRLAASALMVCALAPPSFAQAGGSKTMLHFSMPSNVDPNSVFITQSGVPILTDSVGDISGMTLTSAGAGGEDIYGRVFYGPMDKYEPIVEVVVSARGSDVVADSTVNPTFTGLTPWSVTNISAVTPGFSTFDFRMTRGGGVLNNGAYYALLTADSTDPSFLDSGVSITGYAAFQNLSTPEPGALSLLAGLPTAYIATRLRRSRRKP